MCYCIIFMRILPTLRMICRCRLHQGLNGVNLFMFSYDACVTLLTLTPEICFFMFLIFSIIKTVFQTNLLKNRLSLDLTIFNTIIKQIIKKSIHTILFVFNTLVMKIVCNTVMRSTTRISIISYPI